MRKLLLYTMVSFLAFATITSCKKKGCTDPSATNYDTDASKDDGSCTYPVSDAYGEVTVDMTAEKAVIRVQESIIGNFATDAMYYFGDKEGETIDFAMANTGGIRFESSTRPDGVYPAGDWDSTMVEELFPFGNTAMIVTVTGKELKSICEWGVAEVPVAEGHFLAFSSQVKIVADTTQPGTVIDNTDPDNPVYTSEGSRITSITIGGTAYDTSATYNILTSNYIGEGNDGFVTLAGIGAANRKDMGSLLTEAIKVYLQDKGSVTPAIEGRITYQ